MRTSSIAVLLFTLIGGGAIAQTPTADQLNALKALTPEQQNALLQSASGRADGTGRKTDPKLSAPETVQQKNSRSSGRENNKTFDGRTLRSPDEDPELRADDTVLIDLTPFFYLSEQAKRTKNFNRDVSNGTDTSPGVGGIGGAANGAASSGLSPSQSTSNFATTGNNDFGRVQREEKPRTDEERGKEEKFRDRILKGNPYRLNHFGVLEIPGLPAIPLAGLTADEAAKRLSADPDLREFVVRLTLLRLQPFDDASLKPFGYDLFEGVPSTFAPVSDIQVPFDYVVGAGDTLNVQLYGNEPATYTLTVGRDGRVNFPKLGPISVTGMSFDAARAVIERQVAQQLIGSRVSVTMGDLRSIRVYVLGEANTPGSYTVSGLSTMTNALFVSGGVKKIGSLRNIQLKRNGKLVTVLDLYDLLLHGDTSGDRQLMPGDVIFIPPIGKTVSVYGAVRRPAIYELKSEKDVEQVVAVAGGLLPDADGKLVQLERIKPSALREMRNVDLTDDAGRHTAFEDGDKLRIPLIRPTLENSVELSGYVFRPGAFEYREGLRLSDILQSFDELRPNADQHYIMIRREIPPEEKVQVISADLDRALHARGSAADPLLKPRDKIFVFDLSGAREREITPVITDLQLQATPERPWQVVNIDGKVKAPGRYPLEPSMHVSDLIRAGGSLEDAAFDGEAELTRYEVVDGNARQTELVKVDLAAVRRGEPSADLQLKPFDVLIIKVTPQWEEPGDIVVEGEVRFPGKYPIHRGETLHAVMQRVGGLTDTAFGEGSVFIRDELKKREKEQLELLTNRLQSDLTALSLEALATSSATTNSNGTSNAAQGIAIGQQLIEQLRDTKPVGRLVIDLDRVITAPAGSQGDVVLRDGDRLLVPKKNQEVTILGEVQSPTSHVFRPDLSRDDYIAKSGGVTQKADRKHTYVVRANGDVVSGNRSGWFRRSQNIEMRPGDTIVVPLDTERVRALPLWTQVTTIIYNLAVALLAIHSVSP